MITHRLTTESMKGTVQGEGQAQPANNATTKLVTMTARAKIDTI